MKNNKNNLHYAIYNAFLDTLESDIVHMNAGQIASLSALIISERLFKRMARMSGKRDGDWSDHAQPFTTLNCDLYGHTGIYTCDIERGILSFDCFLCDFEINS